jgi:O-antigen/teichoic acid export membrane protein
MLRLPSAHAVSARLRRLLAASVPSALTGYAYAALAGLDTYFLVLNRRDMVATYGAAKTLSVPPLLVAYALGNMVQSEAAHATPEDAAALRRRILRGGLLVAAAGTGVACAVAAPAVHLLYGHRFPQAPGALRLLAAATALLGLHSLLHTWAFGRGKYHYPLISLSLGILPAVGLNLALVPAIGITGAAAGVLAGTVVAVGALWLLTGRLAAVGADQPALAAGDVPATAAYDGARTSRAATRDPARRS